jgi:hypothetical protein
VSAGDSSCSKTPWAAKRQAMNIAEARDFHSRAKLTSFDTPAIE